MTRQWTPLSVDLFRDPKVRKAGRDAALLFVASLCYCQDQLTDGHIPADHLAVLAAEAWSKPSAAKALVAHGLWVEDGDGYLVARWGEWNKPAAEVRESIEAKSEGGKKGNHEKWHVKRGGWSPTCRYCSDEPPDASVDRSDMRSDTESDTESDTASHIDRFSSPPTPSPVPTENEQRTVEPSLALVPVSAAEPPQLLDDPVRQVFDAWVEATGRTTRVLLDAKRRKVIKNALKNYPVEDVIDAVRGWDRSPFHAGDNDRHTVYNELHHLIGDTTKVEKFRDLHRGDAPTGRRKPKSFDRLQAFAASDGSSR